MTVSFDRPRIAPAAIRSPTRRPIEWTARASVLEILLLAGMLLVAAPLLVSLATSAAARAPLGVFAGWVQASLFRTISGYAGLAVIVAQVSLAARLRARLPGKLATWKNVHKRSTPLLLFVVLVHTGGRWGTNLNGWLLGSLVAMILVAQAGHIAKATIAERGDGWLNEQANTDNGLIHRVGLLLHVSFASVLTTLLGFHVFGAYFFR